MELNIKQFKFGGKWGNVKDCTAKGRKLYKTIKCMSCKHKFRTPVYMAHNAFKGGFSNEKRKESDPCPKCGRRMILDD